MTIHVTPIPSTVSFAAPSFTLGESNAEGDTGVAVASNATLHAIGTKAEMESASTTALAVSPGRTQYHPGVCKAWLLFRHPNIIDAGYNILSVTSNGNSDYTITIDTDFDSVSYCKVIGSGDEDRMLTTDIDVIPTAGTYDVHNMIMSNASAANVPTTAGLGTSVAFYGAQ